MNLQLKLAARYLWGRKLRSFLTTLAIVMGVMVLFGMSIMLPTMMDAFTRSLTAMSGEVDATITNKTGEGFSISAVNKVKSVSGVTAVAGSIARPVNLPINFYGRDSDVTGLNLVGVDPVAALTVREYSVAEGRFLKSGDDDAAVIPSSLATSLGLKVGDTLRIPTTEGIAKLTVVGLRAGRPAVGNEEVMVTLSKAQKLLDMSGLINTVEAKYGTKDNAAREAINTQILDQLGRTYAINAVTSGSEVFGILQTSQIALSMFGVLTLFMGGFIIFNTFRTIVAERRHDIGMLRAIGAKRGTIVGMILTEGLVQGLVGSAIGLALGYLVGYAMTGAMAGMYQSILSVKITAPVVDPKTLILSVGLGVGVTLFSGLLPAVSAGRVTPMEVLRPSLTEAAQRAGRIGTAVGAGMLAVSIACLLTGTFALIALGGILFMLGLVLVAPALVSPLAAVLSALIARLFTDRGTGSLAEGNVTRQPSRSAITASATMIGLAIVVGAGGMLFSLTGSIWDQFRRSMGSDYMLIPPSIAVWKGDVGATQSLANNLRSVPGVGTVSTLRFAQSSIPTSGPKSSGETAISVLGVDPVTYPEVSSMDFQQGDPNSTYAALSSGRNIIINGVLSGQAGVKLGDTVTLASPQGQLDYKVVAIAGDVLNMKVNTAYISQANLRADFNKSEDILFQVNLAQGADSKAVGERLKTIVADYPQFRLVSTEAYLDEFMVQFDAIFAGVYGMLIFMSLPSLIAILNTLAIGVIERTREIGMLRAIGAMRGQIRRMVITEALLLAAIGTFLGLLAGLYFGYVMVAGISASGIFRMEYSFPLNALVLATVAGLAFGLLAAIFPARQAARMEIIQALRYE